MRKLGVLIGILGCICLCGCMSNREKASTHAQKLLEKKYGEKFEVLNMWGNGGKSYYAECYPADDKSLIFKGLFNLEKESFNDKYDQAIFGKQIRNIIQPNMEQLFQDCYVHPTVVSGTSGITDKSKVTVENFVEATKNPEILFYVGINLDVLQIGSFKKEYQKITEYMEQIEQFGIGATMEMRFFHEDKYRVFVAESQKNTGMAGQLQEITEQGKEVSFAFIDGELSISEEEYDRQRKEIQNNNLDCEK